MLLDIEAIEALLGADENLVNAAIGFHFTSIMYTLHQSNFLLFSKWSDNIRVYIRIN